MFFFLPLPLVGWAEADWIEDRGIHGGLAVRIGCDNHDELASLARHGSFLIQALSNDATSVAKAQKQMTERKLIDLCGLPKREGLDGQSLKPLLENPDREWKRPVIITYGLNNYAVQTERWRYILYRDGGEELYDHDRDPNEWTNLASVSKYSSRKSELAKWLPSAQAAAE